MAYNTEAILRDVNGNPIPQNYDPYFGRFSPAETELIAADYFEGTANITKNYNNSMRGISITNDGLENLTFTINDITRTVYAGEVYNGKLDPFTQVIVTATDKYRVEVLR